MTIKLIATDMDGTLLRTDKTFDYARFEDLLDQMDERGIKMVAASGNQVKQLQAYFNPVNPDRLTYVSSNGAMVSDHNGVLYKRPVSKESLQRILNWNRENHAMMENLIVLSGTDAAYVSNHATPEMIELVSQFYVKVIQVEKFMEIDDDILVIELVWPETANVVEYIRALRDVFGEELHTTGSGFGSVSILAAGTTKETGLEALSRIWNIKPEEMAAFGDNGNDLEMLRYVGLPFVMPNAEDFMKVRIDNIALNDNEHNGVIDTMEAILAGAYDENGTMKR